ncbi:hypothetical protein E2C01_082018 [Portunus trituberculatus]|uniref:Uncharacterized protein n=1 Tax=Portunus trituberculatus TaxID=210409 RepID=A0A5B7IZP0_PORTR|nr:hypothetical protein [Portunus trituberculatus]
MNRERKRETLAERANVSTSAGWELRARVRAESASTSGERTCQRKAKVPTERGSLSGIERASGEYEREHFGSRRVPS